MGCHMILLKATIKNRGGDPAQVQFTAVVQRHGFITAVITKDRGTVVASGSCGNSAMPSSDPSVAMHCYFNTLKPLGPAPKLCVQNAFPSMYSNSVPRHGSQASQDTAGRDTLNRKRDLIQTRCLMCVFLSVNSRHHRKQAYS